MRADLRSRASPAQHVAWASLRDIGGARPYPRTGLDLGWQLSVLGMAVLVASGRWRNAGSPQEAMARAVIAAAVARSCVARDVTAGRVALRRCSIVAPAAICWPSPSSRSAPSVSALAFSPCLRRRFFADRRRSLGARYGCSDTSRIPSLARCRAHACGGRDRIPVRGGADRGVREPTSGARACGRRRLVGRGRVVAARTAPSRGCRAPYDRRWPGRCGRPSHAARPVDSRGRWTRVEGWEPVAHRIPTSPHGDLAASTHAPARGSLFGGDPVVRALRPRLWAERTSAALSDLRARAVSTACSHTGGGRVRPGAARPRALQTIPHRIRGLASSRIQRPSVVLRVQTGRCDSCRGMRSAIERVSRAGFAGCGPTYQGWPHARTSTRLCFLRAVPRPSRVLAGLSHIRSSEPKRLGALAAQSATVATVAWNRRRAHHGRREFRHSESGVSSPAPRRRDWRGRIAG